LPLADRARLTKVVRMLNRGAAEELGDLRQKIDLGVSKNVLQDFNEFVIGPDGTFHPLHGSNVDSGVDGSVSGD
jgi:hypothetical protein